MLGFVAFYTTYFGKSSTHCQRVKTNKEGKMTQFTLLSEGHQPCPKPWRLKLKEGSSLSPSALLTAEATIWQWFGS